MGANSALIFGIIINVAILLVFFRFLMQLAAVNAYNPVVMSTVKATKIVDVFGRYSSHLGKRSCQFGSLGFGGAFIFTQDFWGDVPFRGHAEQSGTSGDIDLCHHDSGPDPFLSLPDFCNDHFKLGGDVYSISLTLY